MICLFLVNLLCFETTVSIAPFCSIWPGTVATQYTSPTTVLATFSEFIYVVFTSALSSSRLKVNIPTVLYCENLESNSRLIGIPDTGASLPFTAVCSPGCVILLQNRALARWLAAQQWQDVADGKDLGRSKKPRREYQNYHNF